MALPYRNSKKKRASTYILIGDGFDEYEVIYFLHKFRRQGLPIKSVSLFDQLVFSRQGVGIKADYSLADKPFDPVGDCMLILPSGGRNGDKLRRDARVKSLLRQFNNGRGQVVLTDSGSDLAIDVGQMMTARPTFLPQMDEPLEDFVETLADRMVYAS
ncbi:MAG: DJ-1/PfpI family protein [Chloroflexi bacterium]|nr:DJ-1/PfpI family protein [Chloroflexota bacterium]